MVSSQSDNTKENVVTLSDAIDHSDKEEPQVPDGGWGWMVVLGTTILMFFTFGSPTSFGVIFSRQLLHMGASSTTIVWIFNLFCMMIHLGGVLVGTFTAEFGWRPTAMVASTIVAVSVVISGFATTPLFLFFSFSISTGLPIGLCRGISFTIGAHYFKKYLGMANAFPMAGCCIGNVILPQLALDLQDTYTYLGSMLILGAIILNALPATLLFHPPQWHWKKNITSQSIIESNKLSHHHYSLNSLENNSDMNCSNYSVASLNKEKTNKKKEVKTEQIKEKVLKVIKSILSNLLILQSHKAIIIAFGDMCVLLMMTFLTMVPFAMLAEGHTVEDGAAAASIGAITNFVARISISIMSDFSWFSKRHVYMGSLLVCTFGIAGFTFTESLLWQTVFIGVYGFGNGSTFSLYNLVMLEYMGLEKLGATYEAVSLIAAIGFATIGPFIGFVREYTGSYNIAILMTAACPCMSFIIWLFMPGAIRHDQIADHDTNCQR